MAQTRPAPTITTMTTTDPSPEALLAHYAERIDAGDFDGVGRLFADAAIVDPSGAVIATGADEVAALFRATTRRYEDGTPRTKHVTTNAIVELDDRDEHTAEVRSCFVVFQHAGGSLQPIVAGRYTDQLELRDGAWRFRSRQMRPQLFGDVSGHLLFDVSVLTDPDG
jgi:3-phenylpropionate/cinnamic acid dioxygenase small subunit